MSLHTFLSPPCIANPLANAIPALSLPTNLRRYNNQITSHLRRHSQQLLLLSLLFHFRLPRRALPLVLGALLPPIAVRLALCEALHMCQFTALDS